LHESDPAILKVAKKMYRSATDEDKKVIAGMIFDLEFAIEWMETGRRPGNRRGIERRAAYQCEKIFVPLLMQKYFRSSKPTYEWDDHEKEDVITS
jgi:positive control factor